MGQAVQEKSNLNSNGKGKRIMKKWLAGLACLTIGMLFLAGNAWALSVTDSNDANALASALVGSGVTISNPVYTGGTKPSGALTHASGFFTGGAASGIGIDTGVIMTSGNALLAPGPNNADNATGDNSNPGDLDLTALSGTPTADAAVLQFDFTSNTSDLFFSYVFASEEYNEYANTSFNDVFGFLLDGKNIALIPGTNTPVAINTVNGGNPLGTNPHHPEFFHNNDPSDGGPFFNIQYDGFTDVFTAQALGLSTGSHHMKLAIADGSDNILDSAVFLKAGSFSGTPPPGGPPPSVPEPATLTLMGAGIIGLAAVRRRQTA